MHFDGSNNIFTDCTVIRVLFLGQTACDLGYFLNTKSILLLYFYFQGKLHVIWATGQQEDEFYKNDQLKYHGKQQRGIFVIGK